MLTSFAFAAELIEDKQKHNRPSWPLQQGAKFRENV